MKKTNLNVGRLEKAFDEENFDDYKAVVLLTMTDNDDSTASLAGKELFNVLPELLPDFVEDVMYYSGLEKSEIIEMLENEVRELEELYEEAGPLEGDDEDAC